MKQILQWFKNNLDIVGLIIISIIFITFNDAKIITVNEETNHSKQIDSLQVIIDRLEVELYKSDLKIDSLIKNKSIITNKYETIIQNYNDPTIVSDDSISKYISNKLHYK